MKPRARISHHIRQGFEVAARKDFGDEFFVDVVAASDRASPDGSRTASFRSSRETLRPRVSIRTPASSRCWMSTCRIAEGMSALGASFRAMASLAHSSTDCRNLEYVVTKGSRLVAVSGLASTRQSVAIRSQTNRSSGRWLRAAHQETVTGWWAVRLASVNSN